MNTKSFLIKDTTKEERIALIKEWIPDDDGCSDNCGISLWDMYDAYIKGEKEISQIMTLFCHRVEKICVRLSIVRSQKMESLTFFMLQDI